MKVILRKRISKLGDMGDVVDVAEGYVRNYLVPYKLAFVSSPDAERQIETLKLRRNELEAQRIEAAKQVAAELAGKTVQILVKSDGTKLYGSIHAKQVAEAVSEQLKFVVSQKMVHLEAPIKEVGEYAVKLLLDKDAEALVTVVVTSENTGEKETEEPEKEKEEQL